MNQKRNRLIKCPYDIDKTWRVVKWAFEHSSNETNWWTIEEYREQGLIRATLNPAKELEREIVINVSIIEYEREASAGYSETIDFYKMVQWVEVRIDEDIYPAYGRKEKPEQIIADTQDCIRVALKINKNDR